MAAVTIAAVGAATAAYGAYSSNRNAREARESQEGAMDSQLELGREQLDFSREQYNDWREMFSPVLGDLRTMAYEDQKPDYEAISADVGTAFDTSQDINRRTQQRYGLNPSDGALQNSEVQYGLGRAGAIVDGRNRARLANKDAKFNRLASFYGLGSGQGAQAMTMVNAAYQGVGATYGQHAGMYGNQAMYHQGQAREHMQDAAGWAGWGYGQMSGGGGGG